MIQIGFFFLKSTGRSFHKTAAAYLKLFLPLRGACIVSISTILEYLELYSQSLKTTKSYKQDGESFF